MTMTASPLRPSSPPRSWRSAFLTASAIALALIVLHYFPDQDDGSGALFGGLSVLLPVALALRVAPKVRPLPPRTASTRARLAALALLVGLALGLANLGVNKGMAMLDPAIHEQMVTRWAATSSWSIVIAGPIMEEILFRLILLTALAWVAGRFTDDRRTAFYVAVGVSAVAFGVVHIFYGGVDSPTYAGGMAVKTSAAGVLLGWVFWRWGTPYSAVAHCAANGIHLLLIPLLF